jgi:hypothetical protein
MRPRIIIIIINIKIKIPPIEKFFNDDFCSGVLSI